MDELMDLIGADESAAQVTDKIKDLLYAKSANKVDLARPVVASSLFGEPQVEDEDEIETEAELEVEEPEEEAEE